MSFVSRKFDVAIGIVVGDTEYGKSNPKIAVNASLVVVADVGFGGELRLVDIDRPSRQIAGANTPSRDD